MRDKLTRIVMHKHEVSGYQAECQCDQCGVPFYVGEWFYAEYDGGAPYCSQGCASIGTGTPTQARPISISKNRILQCWE